MEVAAFYCMPIMSRQHRHSTNWRLRKWMNMFNGYNQPTYESEQSRVNALKKQTWPYGDQYYNPDVVQQQSQSVVNSSWVAPKPPYLGVGGKCACAECQQGTWYHKDQNEVITTPNGQEIMVLGQNGGSCGYPTESPYSSQENYGRPGQSMPIPKAFQPCAYPAPGNQGYPPKPPTMKLPANAEYTNYDRSSEQYLRMYESSAYSRKPEQRQNYWDGNSGAFYPSEMPRMQQYPYQQPCRYPPYTNAPYYFQGTASVPSFQHAQQNGVHPYYNKVQSQPRPMEQLPQPPTAYLKQDNMVTNKISPLRLMRKKKHHGHMGQGSPPRPVNQSAENTPKLDVRRFLATWAEDEETPPPPQMVVLDCQEINSEQAELLRWYEDNSTRAPEPQQLQQPPLPQQAQPNLPLPIPQQQPVLPAPMQTSLPAPNQPVQFELPQWQIQPEISPQQQLSQRLPEPRHDVPEPRLDNVEPRLSVADSRLSVADAKIPDPKPDIPEPRLDIQELRPDNPPVFINEKPVIADEIRVPEIVQKPEDPPPPPVPPDPLPEKEILSITKPTVEMDEGVMKQSENVESSSSSASPSDSSDSLPILADLPTSEYRKNKFLDYDQPCFPKLPTSSEVIVPTSACQSVVPFRKEPPSVDILDRPKKKRSRKSIYECSTIFSIQKSHDLKISLRVMNETERSKPNEKTGMFEKSIPGEPDSFTLSLEDVQDREVTQGDSSGGLLKKSRKVKRRTYQSQSYSVSSEDKTCDDAPDGFQVQESIDSAKIKLTFKRQAISESHKRKFEYNGQQKKKKRKKLKTASVSDSDGDVLSADTTTDYNGLPPTTSPTLSENIIDLAKGLNASQTTIKSAHLIDKQQDEVVAMPPHLKEFSPVVNTLCDAAVTVTSNLEIRRESADNVESIIADNLDVYSKTTSASLPNFSGNSPKISSSDGRSSQRASTDSIERELQAIWNGNTSATEDNEESNSLSNLKDNDLKTPESVLVELHKEQLPPEVKNFTSDSSSSITQSAVSVQEAPLISPPLIGSSYPTRCGVINYCTSRSVFAYEDDKPLDLRSSFHSDRSERNSFTAESLSNADAAGCTERPLSTDNLLQSDNVTLTVPEEPLKFQSALLPCDLNHTSLHAAVVATEKLSETVEPSLTSINPDTHSNADEELHSTSSIISDTNRAESYENSSQNDPFHNNAPDFENFSFHLDHTEIQEVSQPTLNEKSKFISAEVSPSRDLNANEGLSPLTSAFINSSDCPKTPLSLVDNVISAKTADSIEVNAFNYSPLNLIDRSDKHNDEENYTTNGINISEPCAYTYKSSDRKISFDNGSKMGNNSDPMQCAGATETMKNLTDDAMTSGLADDFGESAIVSPCSSVRSESSTSDYSDSSQPLAPLSGSKCDTENDSKMSQKSDYSMSSSSSDSESQGSDLEETMSEDDINCNKTIHNAATLQKEHAICTPVNIGLLNAASQGEGEPKSNDANSFVNNAPETEAYKSKSASPALSSPKSCCHEILSIERNENNMEGVTEPTSYYLFNMNATSPSIGKPSQSANCNISPRTEDGTNIQEQSCDLLPCFSQSVEAGLSEHTRSNLSCFNDEICAPRGELDQTETLLNSKLVSKRFADSDDKAETTENCDELVPPIQTPGKGIPVSSNDKPLYTENSNSNSPLVLSTGVNSHIISTLTSKPKRCKSTEQTFPVISSPEKNTSEADPISNPENFKSEDTCSEVAALFPICCVEKSPCNPHGSQSSLSRSPMNSDSESESLIKELTHTQPCMSPISNRLEGVAHIPRGPRTPKGTARSSLSESPMKSDSDSEGSTKEVTPTQQWMSPIFNKLERNSHVPRGPRTPKGPARSSLSESPINSDSESESPNKELPPTQHCMSPISNRLERVAHVSRGPRTPKSPAQSSLSRSPMNSDSELESETKELTHTQQWMSPISNRLEEIAHIPRGPRTPKGTAQDSLSKSSMKSDSDSEGLTKKLTPTQQWMSPILNRLDGNSHVPRGPRTPKGPAQDSLSKSHMKSDSDSEGLTKKLTPTQQWMSPSLNRLDGNSHVPRGPRTPKGPARSSLSESPMNSDSESESPIKELTHTQHWMSPFLSRLEGVAHIPRGPRTPKGPAPDSPCYLSSPGSDVLSNYSYGYHEDDNDEAYNKETCISFDDDANNVTKNVECIDTPLAYCENQPEGEIVKNCQSINTEAEPSCIIETNNQPGSLLADADTEINRDHPPKREKSPICPVKNAIIDGVQEVVLERDIENLNTPADEESIFSLELESDENANLILANSIIPNEEDFLIQSAPSEQENIASGLSTVAEGNIDKVESETLSESIVVSVVTETVHLKDDGNIVQYEKDGIVELIGNEGDSNANSNGERRHVEGSSMDFEELGEVNTIVAEDANVDDSSKECEQTVYQDCWDEVGILEEGELVDDGEEYILVTECGELTVAEETEVIVIEPEELPKMISDTEHENSVLNVSDIPLPIGDAPKENCFDLGKWREHRQLMMRHKSALKRPPSCDSPFAIGNLTHFRNPSPPRSDGRPGTPGMYPVDEDDHDIGSTSDGRERKRVLSACHEISDLPTAVPCVDGDQVANEDEFHDVMENCLERAKRFLDRDTMQTEGHSITSPSCSFEHDTKQAKERNESNLGGESASELNTGILDSSAVSSMPLPPAPPEHVDKEDKAFDFLTELPRSVELLDVPAFVENNSDSVQTESHENSKDVLLSACRMPSDMELSAENSSSNHSLECATAGVWAPEILPVDNWPYLEEEVPLSPHWKQSEEVTAEDIHNITEAEYIEVQAEECPLLPRFLRADKSREALRELLRKKSKNSDSHKKRRSTVDDVTCNKPMRQPKKCSLTDNESCSEMQPVDIIGNLKCRVSLERLNLQSPSVEVNSSSVNLLSIHDLKIHSSKPKSVRNYMTPMWQPTVVLDVIPKYYSHLQPSLLSETLAEKEQTVEQRRKSLSLETGIDLNQAKGALPRKSRRLSFILKNSRYEKRTRNNSTASSSSIGSSSSDPNIDLVVKPTREKCSSHGCDSVENVSLPSSTKLAGACQTNLEIAQAHTVIPNSQMPEEVVIICSKPLEDATYCKSKFREGNMSSCGQKSKRESLAKIASQHLVLPCSIEIENNHYRNGVESKSMRVSKSKHHSLGEKEELKSKNEEIVHGYEIIRKDAGETNKEFVPNEFKTTSCHKKKGRNYGTLDKCASSDKEQLKVRRKKTSIENLDLANKEVSHKANVGYGPLRTEEKESGLCNISNEVVLKPTENKDPKKHLKGEVMQKCIEKVKQGKIGLGTQIDVTGATSTPSIAFGENSKITQKEGNGENCQRRAGKKEHELCTIDNEVTSNTDEKDLKKDGKSPVIHIDVGGIKQGDFVQGGRGGVTSTTIELSSHHAQKEAENLVMIQNVDKHEETKSNANARINNEKIETAIARSDTHNVRLEKDAKITHHKTMDVDVKKKATKVTAEKKTDSELVSCSKSNDAVESNLLNIENAVTTMDCTTASSVCNKDAASTSIAVSGSETNIIQAARSEMEIEDNVNVGKEEVNRAKLTKKRSTLVITINDEEPVTVAVAPKTRISVKEYTIRSKKKEVDTKSDTRKLCNIERIVENKSCETDLPKPGIGSIGGNVQNEITREKNIGTADAKQVESIDIFSSGDEADASLGIKKIVICDHAWKCCVCGFNDGTLREKHVQEHPFHCQSCHLAFLSEPHFIDHLNGSHQDIVKLHHCLLCELSFSSEVEYQEHVKSREHQHLEAVEKSTIQTLFNLLAGQDCPVLGGAPPRPEWLPSQAGTVHFYHQATPLSLAVQCWKLRNGQPSVKP